MGRLWSVEKLRTTNPFKAAVHYKITIGGNQSPEITIGTIENAMDTSASNCARCVSLKPKQWECEKSANSYPIRWRHTFWILNCLPRKFPQPACRGTVLQGKKRAKQFNESIWVIVEVGNSPAIQCDMQTSTKNRMIFSWFSCQTRCADGMRIFRNYAAPLLHSSPEKS